MLSLLDVIDTNSAQARGGLARQNNTNSRIDRETGKTVRNVKIRGVANNQPFDICNRTLWVCSGGAAWPKELWKIELTSGETLTKTRINNAFLTTRLVDSMCSGPDIMFVTGRRGGTIAVLRSDDAQVLYQYDVEGNTVSFYGGDIAHDPQRGLWCVTIKKRIVLLEAE